MAFYPYIILDGYRYRALARQWRPVPTRSATARLTLQGNLEGTFGAGGMKRWEGLISTTHGESSPGAADGTLDGNISTLRTSLMKRQALPFTDHTGAAYSVVAIGPFPEQAVQNVWNAPSNKYQVQVQLVAKA
jgi:hypothetical protein